MPSSPNLRAIAFHLPQFHPIPENDRWWGQGFTEWTNVVRAEPRFPGHYQPHLPADLGFYDLRLTEAREAQANLARNYGIHGFCFYHYWFNGRRLLERPVNDLLATRRPDFPFCLCWANENWTRRWDGSDTEKLMVQNYSAADDLAHFQALLPYFRDPRYIRVEGKPLFLVYRIAHLPEPAATVRRWRQAAREAGLPGLYLCNVESFATDFDLVTRCELDAAVEFAPQWASLPPRDFPFSRRPPWFRSRPVGPPYTNNYIGAYRGLAGHMLAKPKPDYLRYPCVCPMWDNSPRRRENAIIFRDSTPEAYGDWLRATCERLVPRSRDENFVFINAWNEWAEGCHLEPCAKWGRQYLEATRAALAPFIA